MGLVTVLAADLPTLALNAADELAVNFVGDAEVALLAGPRAAQIVSLSANSLGPAALHALGALALPKLKAVDLAFCLNDADAVAAFCAAPLARSLRDLTLRGPAGAAEGVRKLTGSPLFVHLESLEFSGGDLGDEGCAVLAAAAGKATLRRLATGRAQFGLPGDASNSEVTSAGCAALVAAPALARLDELSVALTAIDQGLAAALLGSPLAQFVHLFPGSWATRREAPTGGGWFAFKASALMPAGPPEGAVVGTATMSDGRVVEGCGGAGVWSADGRALALPVWEKGAHSRFSGRSLVRVLGPAGAHVDLAPRCAGSLALYSFEGDVVRGTAGLEKQPQPFEAAAHP